MEAGGGRGAAAELTENDIRRYSDIIKERLDAPDLIDAIVNTPREFWISLKGRKRIRSFCYESFGLECIECLVDNHGSDFVAPIFLAMAAATNPEDQTILHDYVDMTIRSRIVEYLYKTMPIVLLPIINHQDYLGRVPAHYLSLWDVIELENYQEEFYMLLAIYLNCGADLAIKDCNGLTPFQCLQEEYPEAFPEGQASFDKMIAKATDLLGDCFSVGAATKSAAAK